MRASFTAGVVAATLALVALASLLFGWSFERAAMLAPVIVVCAGAIAGLVVLWAKAALSSVAKPSGADRSVGGPNGLDDQTLSPRPGARARGGDGP